MILTLGLSEEYSFETLQMEPCLKVQLQVTGIGGEHYEREAWIFKSQLRELLGLDETAEQKSEG